MNKSIVLFLVLSIVFCVWTISCNSNAYNQGKALYEKNCSNCHGTDGKGLRKLFPPLVHKDYSASSWKKIPCAIRHGVSGQIQVDGKTYNKTMKPLQHLNEIELTNITNYIHNILNQEDHNISLKEVKNNIELCK